MTNDSTLSLPSIPAGLRPVDPTDVRLRYIYKPTPQENGASIIHRRVLNQAELQEEIREEEALKTRGFSPVFCVLVYGETPESGSVSQHGTFAEAKNEMVRLSVGRTNGISVCACERIDE
jgi:hypothetical protein